ncbi:unnamed protein product [Polarella glacialis]|uniref:Major facilitator superfamily (MFS) profile domain-containing protein n=1 Tax=Polarella glacialis TaxID=89957 RepID=A0A813FHL3_POLGL|nr:unnamed protein product [Polarella glacialis]CAE8678862.1 unnamed protein product [Polarella glacialis]
MDTSSWVSQCSESDFGSDAESRSGGRRRHSAVVYVLIVLAFLSVQFGHGSNIGVAVSLPGNSKAMNLALGSWVMVGVSIGLPLTPWACRTFGEFRVCSFCVVMDFLAMLLMLYPDIQLHQIYAVRFLVGFFEAPFLPYLQEWLARFGQKTWMVWNTILHAMVPLGENLGFILSQELVAAGYSWRWAFLGQTVLFAVCVTLCWVCGGRRYLDVSDENADSFPPSSNRGEASEVEYPVTERWCVYWATNVSLAAQLGFLCGCKYVIKDYAASLGFTVHYSILVFSAIALCGPALGGSIVMAGNVIKPHKWSHHKRTLLFLACTSAVAALLAAVLPYVPSNWFWPVMFACFVAAGGVYPASQGIINIALTDARVIEASVYQVQCNNILFAMPMPYAIGKAMDTWSIDASFRLVALLQVLAAAGFAFALLAADFTEERSTWNRWTQEPRSNSGSEVNLEETELLNDKDFLE